MTRKVLVTGDRGYIGSVLTTVLAERGFAVAGLDTGFFEECNLAPVNEAYPRLQRDIRDVTAKDLEGVTDIIHLAGLSNDPLGELAPNLTEEINFQGTMRLAELAKQVG